MHELTCDQVQDAGPQFALGILEPQARAEVAAHLIRCYGCRSDLAALQDSADRLLGVEASGPDWDNDWDDDWDAVADGSSERVRPGRRRVRLVATLAAAAVLMMGTTLGPELEQSANRGAAPLASAQLLEQGQPVGTVYFYGGSSPAIDIQVSGLTEVARVSCELIAADGSATKLGTFKLYRGRGSWAAPLAGRSANLAQVVLVGDSGQVVASAAA